MGPLDKKLKKLNELLYLESMKTWMPIREEAEDWKQQWKCGSGGEWRDRI